MNYKRIRSLQYTVFMPMIILCIFLLSACGGGNSADNNATANSGELNFSAHFYNRPSSFMPQAAQIDCDGLGISTVAASVYDASSRLLASGGPWPCDDGSGTIRSVRSGDNRNIVVLGLDADGHPVFRGQKNGISIVAGESSDAGLIDCHAFVPSLQSPENGADVVAESIRLVWSSIEGADRYRVMVWESGNLDTPVINQTTSASNFTPTGLSDATAYYWQVIAIDGQNTSGAGSSIWSFNTSGGHGNNPPSVQIAAPTQGSTFTSRDRISFSGSGDDAEDGTLSGDALVWTSDRGGEIGTGATFSTSNLSIGTHQITLTVTDSEDATGTDTVTLTVTTSPMNNDPVAQINTPAAGQRFTSSDAISFTGIGTDTEDGFLSGDALVWTSDVDGEIGRGESFTSDRLTPGERTITLTVTDSEGGTATVSVAITVVSLGAHGVTPLDLTDDVGQYTALAVEGDKIFIGYYDETNKKLKVARSMNDGASWDLQTILLGGETGKGTSIAVDGDAVFISTSNTSVPVASDHLFVAISHNNGDDWGSSNIMLGDPRTITTSYDDHATSIAVDGQNMFIVFLSLETYTMHLVKGTYTGTDWEIVELRQPQVDEYGGCRPSIVEHIGGLHIGNAGHRDNIFIQTITPDLGAPESYAVEGVDSSGPDRFTATAVNIVLEHGDMLVPYFFVAYFDQSTGSRDLKIARRHTSDSDFTVFTIDDTSDVVGKYPSMAVTGNTIFISYYDETHGNLKIARSTDNGENWESFVVDDSGDVGQYTSLAANGQRVYISYYDATNKNLKFAKSVTSGETWD